MRNYPGDPMRTSARWLALALLSIAIANPAFASGPWRASEDNIRGWQLMSPQERIRHQARIRGFTRYEDCHAYQSEHHRLMAERAQERGLRLDTARRDACAHLLAGKPLP